MIFANTVHDNPFTTAATMSKTIDQSNQMGYNGNGYDDIWQRKSTYTRAHACVIRSIHTAILGQWRPTNDIVRKIFVPALKS